MKRTLFSVVTLYLVAMCYPVQATNHIEGGEFGGEWHRGQGQFVFKGYAPLAHRPITIHYYIPTKGDLKSMRVLFSMHGAQRTSEPGLSNWRDFAEKEGFVEIAPEYTKKYYNENAYQFGGVMKHRLSDEQKKQEEWTYNTIEAIFDLYKQQTGSLATTYDMFGHSAGGQFTHRFLLAMPNARVGRAIAANPGTWTFLYEDGLVAESGRVYGWPYSVKNTPAADKEYLRAFLSRDLIIHLGGADRAVKGKYVPTDEASLAQGKYRYDRGINYYKHARALARRNGWEFGWRIVKVRKAGHSGREMVYGRWAVGPDGQKQYSVDNASPKGAYRLLIEK